MDLNLCSAVVDGNTESWIPHFALGFVQSLVLTPGEAMQRLALCIGPSYVDTPCHNMDTEMLQALIFTGTSCSRKTRYMHTCPGSNLGWMEHLSLVFYILTPNTDARLSKTLIVKDIVKALGEMNREWLTLWDQTKCVQFSNPTDPTGKPIFIKHLSNMMDELGILNKDDIIIVDDDALKCFYNQTQAMNPPSYDPKNFASDDFLVQFIPIMSKLAMGMTVREVLVEHPELDRTADMEPHLVAYVEKHGLIP